MMRLLRATAADERGVSAIEFALILPIIVMLHIGAVEAVQFYNTQRNVAHIAASMADITAQNRMVTTGELDDIFVASTAILYPASTAKLQQRISSLSTNGSGTVTNDWTVKKNYSGSAAPSAPSGYLTANDSVVVTDVVYEYQPSIRYLLPETIRITRHAYVRPRLSLKVEKN